VAEVLETLGHLAVLVNHAGITVLASGPVPHDPEHASMENWHAVHATHLDGVSSAASMQSESTQTTSAELVLDGGLRAGASARPRQ
jgi:NAD(P)-dependent dehydrogenase (short-subunit alcohol dehydrogenase family)